MHFCYKISKISKISNLVLLVMFQLVIKPCAYKSSIICQGCVRVNRYCPTRSNTQILAQIFLTLNMDVGIALKNPRYPEK